MKAFSIAVAVTLVLAFICVVQSSAIPFTGVGELEEAGGNDTPVEAHQEVSMESWMMPKHVREKRQSHLSLCRYCCNCCKNKGCGFCCRF
ncbi:hepcidin-1 [Xiphophorus hellerii]|uniref:hepcidin-1 n=1 Tax=Xiphophorus hellerii TaxID=8084 RepID=UPI0013B3C9F2|nr:hepcidin [Xiphophorus hellerii]